MESGHVVLFPFLAQGHFIPFVGLAKLIEERTRYTVTLVSTPLNIPKLRFLLPPITSIHLVELPFSSSDHGLPPGSENTDTLPSHLHLPLYYATRTLKPTFELLLSNMVRQHGHQNVCVIADMFLGWTLETTEKVGVFHSVFLTSGAYGSAILYSMLMHPPPIPEHSDEVPLLDYPEIHIHRSHFPDTTTSGSGADPMITFIRRQWSLSFRSHGLLVNTVEEFEILGLSLLRRSPGLPVWAIGPVSLRSRDSMAHAGEGNVMIKWLNSKPLASVVYVSFGSQNTIPASQMMELAMGLEASGKSFIWVVRPPFEFQEVQDFKAEWLPEGFEARMKETRQGLLVRPWAPQMEILSHTSTGAFLSHCGWNSVIESLGQGVPIIGWPLLFDQFFNCKMMEEEMGVCVEVTRWKSSGLDCGGRGVESAIRLLMGATEKGTAMRRKAAEIKEVLKAALLEDGVAPIGSSLKALEDFFHTVHLRKERNMQDILP